MGKKYDETSNADWERSAYAEVATKGSTDYAAYAAWAAAQRVAQFFVGQSVYVVGKDGRKILGTVEYVNKRRVRILVSGFQRSSYLREEVAAL